MNSPQQYCHYSEQQIRESGLLSPERIDEVSAAITARITPAYDGAGKELSQAAVADLGNGDRLLFARVDTASAMEYVRRTVIVAVLTDVELALINKHCLEAQSTAKNALRFAKATKIESWTDGVFHGDDYYASLSDLLEHLENHGDQRPEYVWAAEPTTVLTELHVGDVVEGAISERGWEEMVTDDFEGVAELQAALDKFVQANSGVTSFRPDFSKAILLQACRTA